MSEQHTEEMPTSAGDRKRRDQIAESNVDGSTVTFTFKDGTAVSIDVAKLPEAALFQYALEGVRTAGRLSFQKMDDVGKAAQVLQTKFERMLTGQTGGVRNRTTAVVDDLTQALANILNKDVTYVEEVYYPKYFAKKVSGVTSNIDKRGKVRLYGKPAALDKLRRDPRVKAELDRIAKEKAGKVKSEKLDLESLAA